MSHESRSLSLGMISTATRTTATVCPLTPLANGSAAAQSAHSGFAAALRQLAKQAEDPKGCSPTSQSPVSSPATSLSSPVITPSRGSSGLLLTPGGGSSLPSSPPVVTIAPTSCITSNILWRRQGLQPTSGACRLGRESAGAETRPSQEKGAHPLPSQHLLAHPSYPFGLNPSSVMQDRRLQGLSLPGQVHPTAPSGSVPEEYLRGLRPFTTSDDLRLPSLPLGLDPATAAHVTAAAAFYHPAYLHHLHRMEESLCLSALRSQFYSVPAGGAFPPLHASALHMHLPGARYPGELSHTHSALAERLQMEEELRQREREREREKQRKHEAERERERERDMDRQKEKQRERDMDRQKEKQRERERERQMVKAVESQYLAGLKALTVLPEDRVSPGERLTPNRLDKSTLPPLPVPKPLQTGLHSSKGSASHSVPSLVPSQTGSTHTSSASASGLHGALASAMMLQQAKGDERWLSRQRVGEGVESRRDCYRSNTSLREPLNRETQPHLGTPPPLISPKPHPSVTPTTLWNPASLTVTHPDPRRRFNRPVPPSRPPPGLTRAERQPSWERGEGPERFPSFRGAVLQEPVLRNRAEPEKSTHDLHHLHQKASLPHSSPSPSLDLRVQCPASPPFLYREPQRCKGRGQNPVAYDEIPQQHHRLVSKLDLEESRRREAREEGYYYDLDDSYDESDEEEVRAHLRRVAQQPPLKLDTSSEKVCFLRVFGLTTLGHRDQLLHQKRRKRRRMLRERSISPPPVKGKRKAEVATSPLSTALTSEEMNCTPKLEDKKQFLNVLSLAHVSSQQRADKEKVEGLLNAVKLKTVTLDTIRYNPSPLCCSPPVPSTGDSSPVLPVSESSGLHYPDSPSPSPPYPHYLDNLHTDAPKRHIHSPPPRHPPPLVPHLNKPGIDKGYPAKRLQDLQNGEGQRGQPPQTKAALAGKKMPWETFTPEVFAQHFHQAVLQSTHKTLGGSTVIPESSIKSEPSATYNIPPPKAPALFRTPPHPLTNGHYLGTSPPRHDPEGAWDELSEDEEEQEGEEEEEAPRKWRGIESVFEAYQEYVDERGVERQVLHSQSRRLESQNYTLSLTAEQLSHSMAELSSQRQRVREERERLQAQLEHFRKCLTLPSVHWGRGQVQGRPPR
ncbi:genetic suppressor element 1 [Esox lucius]|uniref:genetic suppressor element 1 n=1 Tax=Esox lucius TaxID=8010 RepID=UPI0014772719|nr:genetic suppressor element 1 [Esox lucius]